MPALRNKKHNIKLNQWFATAICGNDILSSVLYVSGIAIVFAGVYAPLVLLVIVLVLFFYKAVYTEVVEALPLNGGAYNCLLNGTSKTFAAIAGVMTALSYVATAVISAKIGVEYLHALFPKIPVIPTTIFLLFLFALLVVNGIKDSARVAFGIFVFHIFVLILFLGFGAWYFWHEPSYFSQNWELTHGLLAGKGGFLPALYLAFSASLLGVSGFESSANFVEEQKRGVFRKTLRNMLIGVAIFNPLVALIALNSLPFSAIETARDFLLADVARAIGGTALHVLVSVDAFLVLSGAVLTAYVGVSGLLHRMTNDGCMPSILRKENSKGSFPRIVWLFFAFCSSILLITRGNLLSLAGVYAIAFLGVMSLFALGNLTLRKNRPDLKRTYHAPLLLVVLAFFATFFGVLGNIRIDDQNLAYFELYFIPVVLIVLFIIYQDRVLLFLVRITNGSPKFQNTIVNRFHGIIDGKFVVFVSNPQRLGRILDYIFRNEVGRNIILVHCHGKNKADRVESEKTWKKIDLMLHSMKSLGIFSELNIEVEFFPEVFGPKAIALTVQRFGIAPNRIFVGSIHNSHHFDYDTLGGVRIVY